MQEMDEQLQSEYDDVFTDDEKINHILKLTSDSYTRSVEKIRIKAIGFSKPVQLGRQDTVHGLTETVAQMGVANPIHVMTVDEDTADEDYQYMLIDGLRRIYGALRNNQEEIDAVVWDFKDKDKGTDIALVLTLILNRVQRRTWNETWNLYKILEMQDNFTPGILEFLLQLEGGDAMKLKDVMLCEYDEVKEALLSNEKNLDACYKMLQKLRKEEDALMKEDVMGVSDISEDASELAGDNIEGDKGQLSDNDVRELLEMADNMDDLGDISSDDFADMNAADDAFVDQQKVGERHPLDPTLRNAVLARDDFTCACCGMRMIGIKLGLIAVHHVLPVHVGGKDTMDNLITLDVDCHLVLHSIERNGGSILMSEDDYNSMSEGEQIALKRARKYALVAIEADKRRGLSKKDVQEATQDAIRHPMPGAGLTENRRAYAQVQKDKQENKLEEQPEAPIVDLGGDDDMF